MRVSLFPSLVFACLAGCATEEEAGSTRYHSKTFCGPAGGTFTKVIKSEGEPACAAVDAHYPYIAWPSLPSGWMGDTTFMAKEYSGVATYKEVSVRYKVVPTREPDSLRTGADTRFLGVRLPDSCVVTTPCI